jgi:hypothetical protein
VRKLTRLEQRAPDPQYTARQIWSAELHSALGKQTSQSGILFHNAFTERPRRRNGRTKSRLQTGAPKSGAPTFLSANGL